MSEYSPEFSISEYAEKTGQTQAAVKRALKEIPETASFSTIAAALTNAALTNATAGTGNRISISELARMVGLDRNTVAKRLDGLEPIPGPKNSALYELSAALPRLFADEADMDEAKLRDARASADIKEKKLAQMNGELGSVAEFTEATSDLFSAVYDEFAVQYPIDAAARLARAKNATATATILRNDFAAKFKKLRDDYTEFLKSR